MSTFASFPDVTAIDRAQDADFTAGGAAPGPATLAEIALVNRVTMGVTRTELSLVRAMGLLGYLDHQLNPDNIDDTAIETRLQNETPEVFMSAAALDAQPSDSQTRNRLVQARILRAVFSRKQLLERMVDLWVDHFNIDINASSQSHLRPVDDREVTRRYALTTFPQLLSASAHSPSMLRYLDNDTNRVGRPNENYARELMELHTMGVDGGYTQQDVQEVARCFTGWTYYGGTAGASAYQFRFISSNHDNGQKIVLGNILPSGMGQQAGETVLRILWEHPSTARFIARKLLLQFWGYNPPASLVEEIATIYRTTNGDLRAMVRSILNPYRSPQPTPKYKRPFHYAVSVMRALGATVAFPNNTSSLLNAINNMGHMPYAWGPPDGYPDEYGYWVSLLLPRWNFCASLMAGSITGVSVDSTTLVLGATKPVPICGRLGQVLYGGSLPASERARLISYMGQTPSATRIREAIGLAASAPGFQWY